MSIETKQLNQAVIVLLVVGALVVGINMGQLRLLTLIPMALVGMMLIGKMEFLWCLLIMVAGSRIPLVGSTSLYSVLALGYSGAGLLFIMMHKGDRTPMKLHHRYLMGFLFVSIMLPMVRGIGIRALGSSLWGGMQYITLWGGLGFCLFSNKMRISEKNLIRAAVVMLVVAAAPGCLRYANEVLGGRLNFVSRFIGGVAASTSQVGTVGDTRLEGIQESGVALILLSMALLSWKKTTTFKTLAIFFAGVFILGLAGYRSSLMMAGLTIGFYYIQMRKMIRRDIKKAVVIIGCVTLVSLPFLLPYLPFGFQRMFAWLPGANISAEALQSAQGTSDWRVEMWVKMLPMIPDYLIIGRGLGYELSEAYQAYISSGDISMRHDFFIATHQYHNGPLYLLMDYGALGFFCATGFMVTAIRRHWRASRGLWENPWLKNLHALFLARFTANVVMFYFIFGALASLVAIFLDVVLLDMIVKAETRRQKEAKELSERPALQPRRVWGRPTR